MCSRWTWLVLISIPPSPRNWPHQFPREKCLVDLVRLGKPLTTPQQSFEARIGFRVYTYMSHPQFPIESISTLIGGVYRNISPRITVFPHPRIWKCGYLSRLPLPSHHLPVDYVFMNSPCPQTLRFLFPHLYKYKLRSVACSISSAI